MLADTNILISLYEIFRLMTVTGISEEDANKELFINKEHYFAVMARI